MNFTISSRLQVRVAALVRSGGNLSAFFQIKFWWKIAFAALLGLCIVITAHAAVPVSWKSTGFAINATGLSLTTVLQEFSVTYGVKLHSSLSGDSLLRGRLQAANGADFLDRLAANHGFRWFVYNDTLYVVRSNDATSIRIEVGEDAVLDSKAALIGLGLFDSRFGWGEIPDEGVVIVSGPRKYVDLVRETLLPISGNKKNAGQAKQIMVFRLKYASATDRTISTRGQADNVIPGVKTILSGLLNTSPPQNSFSPDEFTVASDKRSRTAKSGRGSAREVSGTSRNGEAGRATLAGARDLGTHARNTGEDDEPDENKRTGRQKNQTIKIDADQSLNAIIIYDSGNKRAMYQALIAELDIEPQQIEIEALIVDIDRSKLNQLGAEWGFNAGNLSATFNGTSSDSNGTNLPVSGSTLMIRNAANFYARLTAMESKGDARVLAKPTISTLENIAAVLDLSQSAYLPLVGERVVDLANVNVGTMLKVTPRIVREGALTRVRLDVNIEDGAFTGQSTSSTNVTRSTITTQAIIEPQHTLLIGGYHSEAKTANRQKIPVLGDMPVIGALFQSSSDGVRDRERLFLITPRILGQTALQANRDSTAATRARELLTPMPIAPQKKSDAQASPVSVRFSEPQTTTVYPPASDVAKPVNTGPVRGPAPDNVLEALTKAQKSPVIAVDNSLPAPVPLAQVSQGETRPSDKKSIKKKKQQVLLLRYRQ